MLSIKIQNEMNRNKAKDTLISNYTLATMIANFVGLSMNGKSIPKVETLFPATFGITESEEDELTDAEYNRAMMIKEQFIDFANRRNEILRNKEGEISGS